MSDSLLMTSYRVWFNLEGKITPFLTFTEIVFKKITKLLLFPIVPFHPSDYSSLSYLIKPIS